MAIENTTRNGLNKEQYLALATETILNLKWDCEFIGENRIEAVTPFSLSSWSEKFIVSLDPNSDEVRLTSVCSSIQIYDFGRNKRNIENFIIAFYELKNRVTPDELIRKAQRIGDILKGDGGENSRVKRSMSFKETMSALIPTKDCFVNPILIYVNVFVFLLMVFCGVSFMTPTNMDMLQWGANYAPLTLSGEWWRLLTSCFLHIGFMHLFMNMYALLYIGVLLEPILGRRRYLVAYILTGIISSSVSLMVHSNTISAGASGAIFGLYGLFLVMLFTNQTHSIIRRQFLVSILIFVGINLIYGLKAGIDNAAHLGGLFSGIALGLAYLPSLKAPENKQLQIKTLAIVSVCTLIIVVFAYNSSSNDEVIYHHKMEEFSQNEAAAEKTEDVLKTGTDEQILLMIQSTAIPSWKKNLALAQSLDSLNINEKDLVQKLIKYSTLRIQFYTTLEKAVSEKDIAKYQNELDHYSSELKEVVDDINAHYN